MNAHCHRVHALYRRHSLTHKVDPSWYSPRPHCQPALRSYALKVINKARIVREKKVEYIKNERNLIDRLEHPGIVQLFFTFQDDTQLYMGLERCQHGELFTQIQRVRVA
jgi:serine/threonine protein kinase